MSRDRPPTLVVMLGGMDGGRLESLLRDALEASALDAVEATRASNAYESALLLADRAPALTLPAGLEVELDSGAPFQFGRRLSEAVAARDIDAVLYLGGGSGPLLDAADFAALAEGIAAVDGPRAVTNNFYSADLFALRPASVLGLLDPPPAKDNAVPRRLREELGVETAELPRTLATQFNLDTPIDLAALALSGRGGPRVRALLEDRAVAAPRLIAAAQYLADRDAEVLVAGRVSSRTWQYLERQTACRVRMLAEERGMAAMGREEEGSARSILGMLIEAIGPHRFFEARLPELCHAAFLDIRPALAHLGIRASRADRFAADLGLVEEIEDPRLREFVEAANRSPVPVALGGHSLVSGALMLLNDWAWEQLDGARRPASTPV